MAQTGYGTTVRVSDAGTTIALTTTPTKLGEVTNVTPPTPSRDIIDVTHMESANQAREFIVGLIDYGECSFDLNWIPNNTTDSLLNTIVLEEEPREYELSFAIAGGTTVTCTFSGYVTGYERTAPMDDKMTGSVTLKVTGEPVWA